MQMKITLLVLLLFLLTRAFIVRHPDANAWSISGQECHLSSSVVSEIVDPWSGTWTVGDNLLNTNQLQDVVDCVEEGDTVTLKVSKIIRLDRALVVKKNLVIKSVEVNAKASMTCPLNDSLLLVENADVVLENIIIQDCPFQGLDIMSIVKLMCDEMEDESFMLTLLNVEFKNGDKSRGLTRIDAEHPKCFSVTEKKVEGQTRSLQSTDLSSKVKIQNSMPFIVSPTWEAGDSHVNSSNNTLNVENQNCTINHYLSKDYGGCVECESDQYNFHPDNETCKSCPRKADCSEEYVLPHSRYWNSFPCSKHIQKCIKRSACLGLDPYLLKEIISESDPATCRLSIKDIKKYQDAQCADGYQGLLCGSCKDDYRKIGRRTCVPCPSLVWTIFSVTLTAALLIYTAWEEISASLESINARLLRRLDPPPPEERETNIQEAEQHLNVPREYIEKAQNAEKKFVIVLQIFVNFAQGLEVALFLDHDWFESVDRLLEKLDWINQNVSQMYEFSFECLLPPHGVLPQSFLSILLELFAPFMIIWLLWMYWLYDTIRLKKSWKHFVKRCILSTLSVIYVSFLSLFMMAWYLDRDVDVFDAISLNDVDAFHNYWFRDTSIKGVGSSYYTVLYWVSTSVESFLIGLISGSLVMLCVAQRRDVFESGWVRETFGVLIIGYRRERTYWEIIIIFRKLFLALAYIEGNIAGDRVEEITIAVTFMLCLRLHLINYPYRTDFGHLNFLEGISLFVCALTAVMCTMLSSQIASSSIAKVILISIVTISSTLTYTFFGYHLVTNKFIEIKYTLVFEGVVSEDDSAVIVILKYWRVILRNKIKFFKKIALTLCPCLNRCYSETQNEDPSTSLLSSSNV